MATIGSLVVSIEAMTAKLDEQIKQSKSHFDSLRGSIDTVRNALIGLGAFEGLKAIFGIVAEDEKSFALLESQIKATGGTAQLSAQQMADYANQLQNTTIFDDDKVREAEAQLTAFTNIAGDQFKRTIAVVLDFATVTGRDASQAVRTLGEALNDPISSLGRLTQAGISLDEATKSQIKSLAQHGQLVRAQQILLDALEKSYGGAAAAARDTFGGALIGLKNAFADLLKGDQGSFDGATTAINGLAKELQDPQIKEGFANIISGLATLTGWLGKAAEGFVHIGQGLGIFVAEMVAGSDDALTQVNDKIKSVQTTISGLQEQISHAKDESDNEGLLGKLIAPDAGKLQQQLASAQEQLQQLITLRNNLQHTGGNSPGILPTLPELNTEKIEPKLVSLGRIYDDTAAQVDLLNAALERQSERADQASSILDSIHPERTLQRQIDQAKDLVGTVVDGQIFTAQDAQQYIDKLSSDWDKQHDQMTEFAVQAQHNIESILGQGLYDGLHGHFDNIAASFADMLEQMLTQLAASKLLEYFGVSNWFTSGSTSTPGASIPVGGHRATGGPVSAGIAYTVGERGEETFIPSTPGTIVPHGALGGNYVGPTFHINASGASAEAISALAALVPELQRAWQADFYNFVTRRYMQAPA